MHEKVRYLHPILLSVEGLLEPFVIYEDNHPGIIWATEHGKRNKLVDEPSHICCDPALKWEAK